MYSTHKALLIDGPDVCQAACQSGSDSVGTHMLQIHQEQTWSIFSKNTFVAVTSGTHLVQIQLYHIWCISGRNTFSIVPVGTHFLHIHQEHIWYTTRSKKLVQIKKGYIWCKSSWNIFGVTFLIHIQCYPLQRQVTLQHRYAELSLFLWFVQN